MKKAIAAGALALSALGLTACGHHLDHGTVTGKEFRAAYYDYYSYCAYWSKGFCTIYIPEREYIPAEYILDLKDGKATGTTDVDQETWDREKVGEVYP